MTVKKIVIAKGIYKDFERRIFISFDENGTVCDIFDIDQTLVSRVFTASVEKVLKDIDASILKLKGTNHKAFIENKYLDLEHFILRHSLKNKVSQADEFFVKITQDKKANKPYTCTFLYEDSPDLGPYSIISFLSDFYKESDIEIVTDDLNIVENLESAAFYEDSDISLWDLYGFTGILDKALNPIVYLKDNANLVIESTEALTSIDINSKTIKKNFSTFDINMEAAKEIVRQIRIRNISGIIIIDFLKDMDENQKNSLCSYIKENAADDYSQIFVYDFTRLGLLEITRSRKFAPLSEIFK